MNAVLNTFDFIFHHPLAGKHKLRAVNNWLRWQLASRLKRGPIEVPFVGGTKLSISRGMHGATGNIYCGLHEFEDMAFVLHFLGAQDLFVDIGANVGSYTILASGVCGAKTISIEPVSKTAAALQTNIDLNKLDELVQLEVVALGNEIGKARMSNSLDCTNHIVEADELAGSEFVVVTTLDTMTLNLHPVLLKIDVEGYEMSVLEGAEKVLADPELLGIIIELNGSGKKYGVCDQELVEKLQSKGFESYQYEPFERSLKQIAPFAKSAGNALFLRNPELVKIRIENAPRYKILGQSV